jgi:sRNA-binding regulator protein Hfq
MSFSQQNKGPSSAELQRYIREQKTIEFLLSNGERLVGTIRWFDEQAFSVIQDGEQPFTILRSAVIGYRVSNKESN